MDSKDKELEELKKEVARLTKRNKLLTKRIKKLDEENTKLVEELEELEAYKDFEQTRYQDIPDTCPECGHGTLELGQPDGSKFIMCEDFPTCKYRQKLKND